MDLLNVNDQLHRLYHRWKPLIYSAAERYEVSGKIDRDDTKQTAMIELWKMLEEGWDPTSVDFAKMFKTRLWHRVQSEQLKFRTLGRDVKREMSIEYQSSVGGEGTTRTFWDGKLGATVCERDEYSDGNPSDIAEHDELIQILRSRLSPSDRLLFDEMWSPSARVEEAYQEYFENRKINYRSSIPLVVYGKAAGLTYKQARLSLERIREQYCDVFDRIDLFEFIAA